MCSAFWFGSRLLGMPLVAIAPVALRGIESTGPRFGDRLKRLGSKASLVPGPCVLSRIPNVLQQMTRVLSRAGTVRSGIHLSLFPVEYRNLRPPVAYPFDLGTRTGKEWQETPKRDSPPGWKISAMTLEPGNRPVLERMSFGGFVKTATQP